MMAAHYLSMPRLHSLLNLQHNTLIGNLKLRSNISQAKGKIRSGSETINDIIKYIVSKIPVVNIPYCTNQCPITSLFQAVQDVQGPEVHLHADGGQPGRGVVDYSQGQR